MHGHEPFIALPGWIELLALGLVLAIVTMPFWNMIIPIPVGYKNGRLIVQTWCGTGMHPHYSEWPPDRTGEPDHCAWCGDSLKVWGWIYDWRMGASRPMSETVGLSLRFCSDDCAESWKAAGEPMDADIARHARTYRITNSWNGGKND